MSTYGIEKALWDITRERGQADAFRADAQHFLSAYQIDPSECLRVAALDVRALSDQGVGPMLLMAAWNTLRGPATMGQYLERMNGSPPAIVEG